MGLKSLLRLTKVIYKINLYFLRINQKIVIYLILK